MKSLFENSVDTARGGQPGACRVRRSIRDNGAPRHECEPGWLPKRHGQFRRVTQRDR